MLILTFDDYLPQARRLADALARPLAVVECRRFPDGESLVRVPVPLPEHVVLVRSLDRPNDKLVELLLAAEAARELGARRVSLVAPYLCYMRQDIAFRPGEAVSQRIVGRFLGDHFDDVVTVDAHLHRISRLDQAVRSRNALNVSAAAHIGEFVRERCAQPLIVGPDAESSQWAGEVARAAGTDCIVGEKHRRGDRDVSVALPAHACRGRHAVIVDDVASTGRTVLETAGLLQALGVARVDVVVTHAVFADGAVQDLLAGGVGSVWSTDSIAHATNVLPLAPLLAEALRAVAGAGIAG